MKKRKKENMLLSEYLDSVFAVYEEKVEDGGEDSYIYSTADKAAFLAVCDGCGGLGSLTYPEWGGRTGAYMASRAVAFSLEKWFDAVYEKDSFFSDNDSELITESIHNGYTMLENIERPVSKIKGSMVRPFPTTLAAVLIKRSGNKLALKAIWAGDSRVYCLSAKGLAQLTIDDIYGEDALSNLTRDGALTNVISSDGNYEIHSDTFETDIPCVVIAATDGCFGYIPTPMHFEYMLLVCLCNSTSYTDWKENIGKCLKEISGDDATMCVAVFGKKSFSEMKNSFFERKMFLEEKYIVPLENSDDEIVQTLWSEYKTGYYSMLKEEKRRLYL